MSNGQKLKGPKKEIPLLTEKLWTRSAVNLTPTEKLLASNTAQLMIRTAHTLADEGKLPEGATAAIIFEGVKELWPAFRKAYEEVKN